MNHVLLGAALGLLFCLVPYAWRGFRAPWRFLIAIPLVMAACGLWAVLPDIPRLLGLHDLYLRMANDPRCDLFFWHYTIDGIENDAIPWHGAIVPLFAAPLAMAWRELVCLERRLRKDG